MVGQAPDQNGTPTNTSSNSGAPSRVLLDDSIFKSLHDAFQMGWNIIELKSRLQLASVSSNIKGIPTTIPTDRSVNSEETHELRQKVLPKVASAQSELLQPAANIIHPQPATTTAPRLNLTDLPDSTWSTGIWRATFNCIADSHKNCFPDSSTENTYYDLPGPPDPSNPPNYQVFVANPQTPDAANIQLPYYYLYPGSEMDYANVGIPQDDKFPDQFKLYDVTRRALNCLTLLYTNPGDSLIPLTLSYNQQLLLQNISTYEDLAATLISNTASLAQSQTNTNTPAQDTAPQGDAAPVEQSGAGPDTGDQAGTGPVTGDQSGAGPVAGVQTTLSLNQRRTNAILLVSNHTLRYLDNWDSYARETLYVSQNGVAQSNELQLVAYEAGRAMSSLSWAISTATTQLEDDPNQTKEVETLLKKAWSNVFDEPTIASVQHQISALSTALDGAYYRVHSDISRPTVTNAQEAQNLDLPSQGIQAISSSLEYWRRAVKKICEEDNQQKVTTPGVKNSAQQSQSPATTSQTKAQKNGPASTQQDVTAQPPAIPKMSSQTSSQLRQALVKQSQVWQPLLLHQQSLQDFTLSYVTQRIWNDFMKEYEQATRAGVFNTFGREFRRYLIPVIAGIVILVLILGFIVFLLARYPSLQQSLVTTFVLVIGSVVGFFGTTAGRVRSFFSTAPASATSAVENMGSIGAVAGIVGTGLVEAFQGAYHQIQMEFDYLDHNVSVTYPLVEFFIANAISSASSNKAQSQGNKKNKGGEVASNAINDAYDFLTQIVWTDEDRAEEIARITRAALGPIGALIASSTKT